MPTMLPETPLEPLGIAPFVVEIIELKWLLAGHGVRLHVERLQADREYARRMLALAAASPNAALRTAAARLHAGLRLDDTDDCRSA